MPESVLSPAPVSTANRPPARSPWMSCRASSSPRWSSAEVPPPAAVTGGRLANPVMPIPGRRCLTGSVPAEPREGGPVFGEVPGLAAGIYHDVADDSGRVDDEGAALGHPAIGVEHPVDRGHGAVRPEVGEEVKAVAFLFGIGPLGELAVHGDGQHSGIGGLE